MTPLEERPEPCDVLASYLLAKVAVLEAGFESEIVWQEHCSLEDVDESRFLREAAWVVLSSGMREAVIRRVFPAFEAAFDCWRSSSWIVQHGAECKAAAMKTFRCERKVSAVLQIAARVAERGVKPFLADLRCIGPDALLELPYMGPATSRHLAKNLGLDTGKPDRHLMRVTKATGYASPRALCENLACTVGDTAAVVDLVIWRFATINADYVEFFRQRRCPGPWKRSSGTVRGRSSEGEYLLHGARCIAG